MDKSNVKRKVTHPVRDWVHRVTGQTPLIAEYRAGVAALSRARDAEKDRARKLQIVHAIEDITDLCWVVNENRGLSFFKEEYDPRMVFQTAVLKKKVAQLNAAFERFGIKSR